MKVYHEFKCPSCKSKLRMNMNPSWKIGNIRCPSCVKRVSIQLSDKTRREKKEA